MRLPCWILVLWSWIAPRRKLIVFEGDTPPSEINSRDLFIAREDGEDWAVAFKCPCGCGDRLELQLVPEVKPNWSLQESKSGHPSLHPSIWRKTNCKSHFWIKGGRVFWSKN